MRIDCSHLISALFCLSLVLLVSLCLNGSSCFVFERFLSSSSVGDKIASEHAELGTSLPAALPPSPVGNYRIARTVSTHNFCTGWKRCELRQATQGLERAPSAPYLPLELQS